jgi:hypothetical protein
MKSYDHALSGCVVLELFQTNKFQFEYLLGDFRDYLEPFPSKLATTFFFAITVAGSELLAFKISSCFCSLCSSALRFIFIFRQRCIPECRRESWRTALNTTSCRTLTSDLSHDRSSFCPRPPFCPCIFESGGPDGQMDSDLGGPGHCLSVPPAEPVAHIPRTVTVYCPDSRSVKHSTE